MQQTITKKQLEEIINACLEQKLLLGRKYAPFSVRMTEFSYIDADAHFLLYTIKKEPDCFYLVELEELEKKKEGICRVSIYTINFVEEKISKIHQTIFKSRKSLYAKAQAAKFCSRILNGCESNSSLNAYATNSQ